MDEATLSRAGSPRGQVPPLQEGGERAWESGTAQRDPFQAFLLPFGGLLPFSGDNSFSFPPCLLPSEEASLPSEQAATVSVNIREVTEVPGKWAPLLPEHVPVAVGSRIRQAATPPPAAVPGRLQADGGAPVSEHAVSLHPQRHPLFCHFSTQARAAAGFQDLVQNEM